MSTLYIRLPSRSAAGSAPHWPALPCPFALVSGGTIERQGVLPLPDLSATLAAAQRVVLLLAAADVAVLRVKVPPLSNARLKAALPNLVEDRLLGDPSGSVVVAGGSHDGLRTVAVAQRAWLEHLAKTLIALGARHIAALPAQLCLSFQPGQPTQPGHDGITAAIDSHESGIDLTLRLSEHDGIGLTVALAPGYPEASNDEGRDPQQSAAHEAIRALRAVAPEAPVTLYVPQAQVSVYQQAVTADAAPISVSPDNWTHWQAATGGAMPDLMSWLGASAVPGTDLRAWRWPLALAAAILIVNIAALNYDWWSKRTESDSLRAALTRIYKAAYPNETVIIDPVAQMQQKIAAAKRGTGQPLPDDFTMLAAAFGEACASVIPGKTATAISGLEYHDRSLSVQIKPAMIENEKYDMEALTQQMKEHLAGRGLSLELAPAPGGAAVWQIRSVK